MKLFGIFRVSDYTSDQRRFTVAMVINSIGGGLFVTVSALYFTRIVGMSLEFFGLVISLAAGCGLIAGPLIGHYADTTGARRLYVVVLLFEGAGSIFYVILRGPAVVAVLLCAVTVFDRGAGATRGAFIADLVAREGRVKFRAAVRSMSNAGAAVGAAAGAAILAVDTPFSYRVAIGVNAASYVVTAALIFSTSASPKLHAPDNSGKSIGPAPPKAHLFGHDSALRNMPFMVITLLNAVLLLNGSMITVALPLWVAKRTDAPLWIVSVVLVINTVAVVFLQVPASRRVNSVPLAARAGLRAGIALAAASLLIALSGLTTGILTVAIIVAVALTQVAGELWQSASSWALVFELAPERSLGQYQGFFNAGVDIGALVAPALFALIVAEGGFQGWEILAGVFVISGMLLVPVARWASHSHGSALPP
ncbi:MFS transporter [Ferrimicrobium sp.]|uniref:MFS transporter n=1 Tax=Ferrimicrobium sp. TaxID=2926050 RepID=UPI002625CEC3|nr:MFS transporter [Ferrimicrobium sp.]